LNNETLLDLRRQKNKLSAQVFSLLEENTRGSELEENLRENSLPADPELAKALNGLFQKNSKGQKEFLRMELDELRRGSRSRETEHIFRAYGVLTLVTPLRSAGKTVHLLNSGPLKVSPWTPQEKETLASICGLSVKDLPASLDQAAIYHPSQIQLLVKQQNREVALLSRLINVSEINQPASTEPMASSMIGLDLLQPGFADHLDVLFTTVQKELKNPETISQAASLQRIQTATQRGRHLAGQIRQLSAGTFSVTESVSVHQILEQWKQHFCEKQPSLRINLRLDAQQDQLIANPYQLQHMLFTLMASVADGLPEGQAIMGLSTRNLKGKDTEILHLEIRDGGGLATFAGVGGETDRQVRLEQSQADEEFEDWFTLASHMDAELHLLRDEGTITRAELLLPLHPPAEPPTTPDAYQLWIVEDDDREYEGVLHMLSTSGFHCSRFTSAADLRKNFDLAAVSPDMVLLKYHLPDQRGAEVRAWLYEQDSNLPVILVSGLQATHPGIATANSLPSTLYLQKPFDAQTLLDMVNMNLNDTLPG